MIEALAEAIEGVGGPVDRAELVALVELADRLAAKVSSAVADYDEAQRWDLDGATSMRAWLVDQCDLSPAAAERTARRARRLRRLPATAAAWEAGRLTGTQVDIVVELVRPHLLGLFASQEDELVPALEPLDGEQTAEAVRFWVARAEALVDGAEPRDRVGRLHLATTIDGIGVLDATFDPDSTTVVAEALRFARRADDEGERRTRAQRDADALVDALSWYLAHRESASGRPGRAPRRTVVVTDVEDLHAWTLQQAGVVDERSLAAFLAERPATTAIERAWLRAGLYRLGHPHESPAATIDGKPLSLALAAALSCDSTVRRLLTAGSEVLDYGRPAGATEVPSAIRDAVTARDQRCRYPRCDRTVDWCEVHHVHRREDGGAHAVGNCVLLCARHHHVLHRPGWRSTLEPDGTLTVTDPGGRTRSTRPPGPRRPPPDIPPPTLPWDRAA